MGIVRGRECQLWWNSALYAAPTWVQWDAIDVTLEITYEMADVTSRASGKLRVYEPVLGDLSVSGSALLDRDDASLVAMETAMLAGAAIEFLVMEGDRTSADSAGWRFSGKFESWNQGQPLDDVLRVEWSIKPARSDNAPAAVAGPQASSDDEE